MQCLVNGYYSIGKLVHPLARSLEAFRKISHSDQQCVQSSHNPHRCECWRREEIVMINNTVHWGAWFDLWLTEINTHSRLNWILYYEESCFIILSVLQHWTSLQCVPDLISMLVLLWTWYTLNKSCRTNILLLCFNTLKQLKGWDAS